MVEILNYENGLKVFFEQNKQKPYVGCAFIYNVGAYDELPEKSGIAHVVEHNLENSSLIHDRDFYSKEFELEGALLNARTEDFKTSYEFKCLTTFFPKAFEYMSEMVYQPKFDDQEFENELNVIIAEIGMNQVDDDHFSDILYSTHIGSENYSGDIGGTNETVSSFTKEDVINFYESHYNIKNLTISIVGDTTKEEIDNLVKTKLLPFYQTSPYKFEFHVNNRPQIKGKDNVSYIKNKTKDSQWQNVIEINFDIKKDVRRMFALRAFENIMAEGFTARFLKILRNEYGYVYSIDMGYNSLTQSEEIFFDTDKNNVPKALYLMRKIIDDVAKNGITDQELKKFKNTFNFILSTQDDDYLTKAFLNYETNKFYGEFHSKEQLRQVINSITKEDVQDVAKEISQNKGFTIGVCGENVKYSKINTFEFPQMHEYREMQPSIMQKFKDKMFAKKVGMKFEDSVIQYRREDKSQQSSNNDDFQK